MRTLGRDCLPQALASIEAQTRQPNEILLVDSAGSGQLGTLRCGNIPIRVIGNGQRLNRHAASNAAFEAARTDWLGFLDEDDTVEPTHYANLFTALERAPDAVVAYSQTRLVHADGSGRVFGGPFNRFALFQSNYMAIHAVLFSRRVLEAGCRYDTRFDSLEDWDFWLQASQLGAFAFSPTPTAVYYADSGQSGAGGGGNLKREEVLKQRERIVAKWSGVFAKLAERERYALGRAAALRTARRQADADEWERRAHAIRHGDPRSR